MFVSHPSCYFCPSISFSHASRDSKSGPLNKQAHLPRPQYGIYHIYVPSHDLGEGRSTFFTCRFATNGTCHMLEPDFHSVWSINHVYGSVRCSPMDTTQDIAPSSKIVPHNLRSVIQKKDISLYFMGLYGRDSLCCTCKIPHARRSATLTYSALGVRRLPTVIGVHMTRASNIPPILSSLSRP